jgi:Uma2 family endonuclease
MPRTTKPPAFETIADLLEQLGGIAPHRVRLQPTPGQATERDLLELNARTNRLYELVDGVLVEKVMGYAEGSLALWLGFLIQSFLQEHDLGNLSGADATMKLMPGLVRIPDLAFTVWEKFPVRGQLPTRPIPGLVPDLAVEVLSKGNTRGEMQRKLREYFLAGTRLVWFVSARKRTVQVFTAPDRSVTLTENQTLDGGDVLPGLALPVKRIFARVPRPAPEAPKGGPRPHRKPSRKGGPSR